MANRLWRLIRRLLTDTKKDSNIPIAKQENVVEGSAKVDNNIPDLEPQTVIVVPADPSLVEIEDDDEGELRDEKILVPEDAQRDPSTRQISARQNGNELAVVAGISRPLPYDLARLYALNSAFRRGLIQLEQMPLDNDLYWRAVEDLRQMYNKERYSDN